MCVCNVSTNKISLVTVVVPLHEKRKNRKKANPSPKASAKKRKPNDGTTDTTTTYVNSENASCIDTGNAISEGYDHVMSDCVCDLL